MPYSVSSSAPPLSVSTPPLPVRVSLPAPPETVATVASVTASPWSRTSSCADVAVHVTEFAVTVLQPVPGVIVAPGSVSV